MKKSIRRLAGALALAVMITSTPFTAVAAEKPKYKTERTSLYENASEKGIYTYTLLNVKKGDKVKWILTGSGKSFASLKYTETTVKGKTSSNKITIRTNKSEAAMNAPLALTAKVYSSAGKLLATVKDKVSLKIQATDAAIDTSKIQEDLSSLSVGETYDFDVKVLPANTTSKIYWTVTSITGKDCSSEINSEGKWTPTEEGKYTIKAMAKNSKTGKTVVYHTASVMVGLSLNSVKQTGANTFTAIFNNDASKTVKPADFSIAATNGSATIAAKSVTFSPTGKMAYITMHTNFKDSTSYTISYGSNSRAFVASVGDVVKAVILTETVEAGKETKIEYVLYDKNNMDVKAAAEGKITWEEEIVNGYRTEENTLFMYTEGKTANLTLTYRKSDTSAAITAKKTIRCVAAKAAEADKTNFTITSSSSEPNFDSPNFKAVTSASIGETSYLHFRALDSYNEPIEYSSIKYISSDDNTLIVDPDGKLTPIKSGTVKVTVIATQGKGEITYTFAVTIQQKKVPTTVSLSQTSLEMSNIYLMDYKGYIDVAVKDQYGNELELTDESCTIKETSSRQVIATYDRINNQIQISARGVPAGTYNYIATFVVNGATLTANFSVVVKTVPSTGSITYKIASDRTSLDMKIDETTLGDRTITVRMEKYVGGIFAGYVPISNATVQKDNLYYSSDLTENGSKTIKNAVLSSGNSLILRPVKITTIDNGIGECRKAETGTYEINLKYLDNTSTARTETISVTINDSQAAPEITVKSTTSSKVVGNALSLVNDCISLSDDSVIYSCTATGSNLLGDAIPVKAGQKLHIDTISIKQIVDMGGTGIKRVYIYYTINLDQTLSNKS